MSCVGICARIEGRMPINGGKKPHYGIPGYKACIVCNIGFKDMQGVRTCPCCHKRMRTKQRVKHDK